MARFYDTLNSLELYRVEALLKRGGIAYSLRLPGDGSSLKEILVAEEDVACAEELLSSSASPRN